MPPNDTYPLSASDDRQKHAYHQSACPSSTTKALSALSCAQENHEQREFEQKVKFKISEQDKNRLATLSREDKMKIIQMFKHLVKTVKSVKSDKWVAIHQLMREFKIHLPNTYYMALNKITSALSQLDKALHNLAYVSSLPNVQHYASRINKNTQTHKKKIRQQHNTLNDLYLVILHDLQLAYRQPHVIQVSLRQEPAIDVNTDKAASAKTPQDLFREAFIDNYEKKFKKDKASWCGLYQRFARSRLKEKGEIANMSIEEIIKHAKSGTSFGNDNRTFKVLVEMNCMKKTNGQYEIVENSLLAKAQTQEDIHSIEYVPKFML